MKTSALECCLVNRMNAAIAEAARVGLLDEDRRSPHIGRFTEQIRPFLSSPEMPRPIDIQMIITHAQKAGAAFEYMGERPAALRWYQVGLHDWLGGRHFRKWLSVDPLELTESDREVPALSQMDSAFMAALAGDTAKANELFAWAAGNWQVTPAEINAQEKAGMYQPIWQPLGFRIGCLTWLGRWEEVHHEAEIAKYFIERTRRAGHPKDFREPQLLAYIGDDLAAYYLDPVDAHRERARCSLTLSKMPDRDPETRANMLPYLLAFHRKFAEIAGS